MLTCKINERAIETLRTGETLQSPLEDRIVWCQHIRGA